MTGQPLILQCSVNTIKDINSRVDFVWISNDTEVERVEGVNPKLTSHNSLVYTHYYIIPQLSNTDNNSLYTCDMIVNKIQQESATGNFRVNMTSKD